MNTVVLKCGGSVLENLPYEFYKKIVELHQSGVCQPILVHGGGPLINKLADQLGVQSQFVNGLRATTDELLDVVEMALSGKNNKQIVQALWKAGGKSWGISGVDAQLLVSEQINKSLGKVGRVVEVNTSILETIIQQGYIPVISPISLSENYEKHNINADDAASAIASALQAKLCFLSDVDGVKAPYHILSELSKSQADQYIQEGVITGGMIPKVKAALAALDKGVTQVGMLNGSKPADLQHWLTGQGAGTTFVKESLREEEASHV